VAAAALQYEFDARNVYALGYSNGANIAVASLLVAPTTFKGAMLWRAQLTLVPEPPLSLAGKPILLSAGRYDPLIRVDQSEALYEQLRSQGAATSLAWQESQHGLVQSDIEMTAGWFRALIS
jgi:predicted esterase